jgi:predicted ATP-dependent serine protease
MKINSLKNDQISLGSSIKSIKVPQQLKTKLPSGIEWIDDAFGNGFTPSTVTLFTGEPGAGKTTLMLTLADSLAGQGYCVHFNTAEESLYQVAMTCERLNIKNDFFPGQETDIDALIKNCDDLRNMHNNKPFFLIVDSLQTLEDNEGGFNKSSAVRCLEKLTSYAKENYVNIITICQVNKSGEMAGSQKLKHMVDSMIHLQLCDKKLMKELECDLTGVRTLSVEKNRFGSSGYFFFLDLNEDGFEEKFRYGNKPKVNLTDRLAGKNTTQKQDSVNVTFASSMNEDKFSALNKMKEELLKKKQEINENTNKTNENENNQFVLDLNDLSVSKINE